MTYLEEEIVCMYRKLTPLGEIFSNLASVSWKMVVENDSWYKLSIHVLLGTEDFNESAPEGGWTVIGIAYSRLYLPSRTKYVSCRSHSPPRH